LRTLPDNPFLGTILPKPLIRKARVSNVRG
jgi:hypothetical protein